jgi:UDP-GlcNAc:undecaprenyl-phosphate GlcNAc-1-phosphate transferase
VDLSTGARIAIGVGLATALAYAATPLAVQAARRLAFFDLPGGYKEHSKPTPYLGGAAVMFAFSLALLIGAGTLQRTLPLLGGVTVLLVLGTIDDRVPVHPGWRVLTEFTLGALISADGLGWRLGAGGVIDAVITGVWMVAVVNAFNLFDNMDGAAGTMVLVVTAGVCVLTLVDGEIWVAASSAALFGACLGFLPYNLSSPASIFLGDGGSMSLGFAVAMLVANAARYAEGSWLSLLVGFLLVGIPALDTALVIVSRRRRGIGLLTGGRDHLTHRMRVRLRTPGRVALVLGGAQALVSALVIVGSRESSSALVYIVLGFMVFGAAAIVALEDAFPAEEGSTATVAAATVIAPSGRTRTSLPDVGLAVIGLGAGLSPLFSAYFDPGVWVPIGLVLVVVAAMAAVARPPRFTLPAGLAFAGLAGLGLLSLLSTSWADVAEPANVDANLWLSYAALLLLTMVLLGAGGRARTLLIAVGVGIAIVGITVLVKLLGSHPSNLFIDGRLNSPLGYINGEGCVFAMGAWLALALAERRESVLAGVGAALTVAMAGLALLSQSRGTVVAVFVSIILVLAVAPGFRRRVFALVFIAAGLAAAGSTVVHVYSVGNAGHFSAVASHHAVVAIVVAAVCVGAAWGVAVAAANWAMRRDAARLSKVATTIAVILVAAPCVAGVVRFSSLESKVSDQWHAFVQLNGSGSGSSAQSRLLSGGGDRYDYWRIAWHSFTEHPLAGVGAGNYIEPYYLHRQTDQSIDNPHSLEMQVLSELGVLGVGVLIVFIAGLALGIRRARSAAKGTAAARGVMVAGTGTAVTWLVATSGDWMHLLPGVAAIALCGVAALCPPGDATRARLADASRRLPMLVAAAGAIFVLAVGGASLLRAELVQRYLSDARGALNADPTQAISDANRVLNLDAADLDAYYVKAAGQAHFDRAAASRTTLLAAAHESPRYFVTWILLGDLETRAGRINTARSYYRRALRLDPREPGLPALVAHPASGLRGAGR